MHWFTYRKVGEVYKAQIHKILEGNLEQSLLDLISEVSSTQTDAVLKEIEVSPENIYNHHSVVEIENAGYNVMYELLSHFIWLFNSC